MDDSPGFIYNLTPLTVQSWLAPVWKIFYLGKTFYQKFCFCKIWVKEETIFLPELLLWGDEAGMEDMGESWTGEGGEKGFSVASQIPIVSCALARKLCEIVEISDSWKPEFVTIIVTWQLKVTLDSIGNSCVVCWIWQFFRRKSI